MHARNSQKKEQGFTLIELLIVIGIIGFLAAAVLVAVDPVKRIQDSRDARRFSEANAILNAVLNKQVDDRKLYSGAPDAPMITHATNSQVIVTSTAGIECDSASAGLTENYPGCGVTIDNTARAIAGTASSSGTAVTGSGSDFLTSVRVGDTLVIASTGVSPCEVVSIASNTALTCAAAPSPAWSSATVVARSKNCVVNLSDTFTLVGTATSSGATVTGLNTNFSTQVQVGDTLTSASGGTCLVSTIANATSITCSATPSPAFSGTVTNAMKNGLIPNYIASAPIDPRGTGETICATSADCADPAIGVTTLGSTNTGYYLHRTNGNRIEIGACDGEQTATISVKR